MSEASPVRYGAAVRVLPADATRRRGRPAARRFTPEEVAELLAVPESRVLRVLENSTWRAEFLPGAWQVPNVLDEALRDWLIPERDVRRLVGGSITDPPALFSVRRFAKLMEWSVPTAYERIKAGIVKTRLVVGELRVPASEYWTVPEHAPPDHRPRPSFFAQKRASKASEVAP